MRSIVKGTAGRGGDGLELGDATPDGPTTGARVGGGNGAEPTPPGWHAPISAITAAARSSKDAGLGPNSCLPITLNNEGLRLRLRAQGAT